MHARVIYYSLLPIGLTIIGVTPRLPAAQPPPTPEAVVLSPFEVVADASDTYEATNTTSLTGTNTPLNKAPLDARILTSTMMAELGGGDVFKLLSDFGGLGAMLFAGGSEDQRGMQPGDAAQPTGLTSRGFAISEPRRDGFLRSATSMFNSFDVEAAEVINGSNNLLYGSGDAGGVVVINSKRAVVGKQWGRFAATGDSEGSRRYTADINVGLPRVGLRLNGLSGHERYYRPILGLHQKGLQAALTLRPFKWLNVFGDYRDYLRAAPIAASATVRAPTNLVLSNGALMDNQSTRYITGYGGSALIDNYITLRNQDSVFGVFQRQHWTNVSKSVAVDVTPTRDLAFQFRYAHDLRRNYTQNPSTGVIYHPYATGNLYVDANGQRQWSMLSTLNPGALWTGARGYKLTAAAHRDLGRWGDHRINAFNSFQHSWIYNTNTRFYELDSAGNVIQNLANIANADSGRNALPAVWLAAFPQNLIGNISWPSDTLVHPNGKTYRLLPMRYPGGVPRTAANPFGLSGPMDAATGQPSGGTFYIDDTNEKSTGASLASSFWHGRIDTMAGFRFETADQERITTAVKRGPVDYNSRTLGVVSDTPLKGVRVYASYATNAKINFATDRDIYNQILPLGRGETREVGLKSSLWDHRVSGSLTYYVTEGKNFTTTLGTFQNIVDPDGINGRNGGPGFVYSKTSDGLSASLSLRPLTPWQVTLSFTQANGSERSNVELPVFYNDEFNTTTVGGQTVVAVKTASSGALTPLLVPTNPAVATSPQIPLSVAMLKDPVSPYFATLDRDSGQILNAQTLGLRTTGVGTLQTGLPISNHQLGFTPPVSTVIVRRAGEKTTGYAENSFSAINRFQVREGRLRGLVLGLSTVYQVGFRAYMYTDTAAAGSRKLFYYPDMLLNNVFAVYSFKPSRRLQASVQLNISNVFDRQAVLALPRNTTGVIRYFTYQYTPRILAITTNLAF